jgi:hypothetical protein
MKKNIEEGELGDERYRLVAFAIFGLVLFPSEIGVISLEAANVFMEYEHDRINPFSTILGETLLSLNHYRMHGKRSHLMLHPYVVFMDYQSYQNTKGHL